MKSSLSCVHMGEVGGKKNSANIFSNTSQLVMVPSMSEWYHSRASPHRVCKKNLHVMLFSVILKIPHAHWNLNKCCSASSEVFPKNVENFSIGILGI
jgi:hypothetical protein